MHIIHEFLVVNSLVTPVILCVDLLQENAPVLYFSQTPVVVHSGHPVQYPPTESNIAVARFVPIYDAANLDRTCVVSVNKEIKKDSYKSLPKIDMSQFTKPNINVVMENYQELFCSIPCKTNEGYHVISSTGNPVKIPPRRIPDH